MTQPKPPTAHMEQPAAPTSRGGVRHAFDALVARLFAPIDISSLVVFRIGFGLIMIWEVYRYLNYGWVSAKFIDPVMHFSYLGFGWVTPWPGQWMYVHFYALAVLALLITVGLWYRVSAALFCVLFVTLFLMEKAIYLNHLYLVALVSFIMIFVPAHRAFSMDSLRRPEWRSDTVPAWPLVLLVSQFAIVYTYGGIAKLNGDWLRGEPMRTWMARKVDFPLLGRWFTEEWMVYAMSYGGLLIDLFIVPALLWRRTRWFAVVAVVLFHRMNAEMFSIGIFPMFATMAVILFLPPDLPRRIVMFFHVPDKHERRTTLDRTAGVAAAPVPLLQRPAVQRATLAFMAIYLGIQVLVPLRHHLYPGDAAWNEQGDRFSWRMMLHTKSGDITFYVTDPASGETWTVDPAQVLTRQQAGDVLQQPDMAVQFSHFLSDHWRSLGYDDVEVRAQSYVSLNSREPGLLIDPTVDLASIELSAMPMDWLTTLEDGQVLAQTFQMDTLLSELGSTQD